MKMGLSLPFLSSIGMKMGLSLPFLSSIGMKMGLLLISIGKAETFALDLPNS
jgi:hypothetical protein